MRVASPDWGGRISRPCALKAHMKRDAQLTERDREIVAWIARLGAIEATHVRARFRTGRSVGYDRLSVLASHGLVERVTLLHRQPGLYVATREGRRWTDTEQLGHCRVSPGAVRHWSRCGRAVAALEHEFGSERIRSDREIRVAERAAGRPLASAVIGEWPD